MSLSNSQSSHSFLLIRSSHTVLLSILRYSKKKISLIEYASYFGSIQCVKYLHSIGAKCDRIAKFAIAGGSPEMIDYCITNGISISKYLKLLF